jgi:hypothetical protein
MPDMRNWRGRRMGGKHFAIQAIVRRPRFGRHGRRDGGDGIGQAQELGKVGRCFALFTIPDIGGKRYKITTVFARGKFTPNPGIPIDTQTAGRPVVSAGIERQIFVAAVFPARQADMRHYSVETAQGGL